MRTRFSGPSSINRHVAFAIAVVHEADGYILDKAPVDFIDDVQVPGQKPLPNIGTDHFSMASDSRV